MKSVMLLLVVLALEGVYSQQVDHRSNVSSNLLEERLSCVSNYACNVNGDNLIGYYNVSGEDKGTNLLERIDACQSRCRAESDCSHFTWYDAGGAFPLTCYLYSACDSRTASCRDCHSGPPDCHPSLAACAAIEDDYGGNWFCFPETPSLDHPVAHGSRCLFQCPMHVTYHVCRDGTWSLPPGDKRCTCPPLGARTDEEADGRVVCWPPLKDPDQPVEAGTYCIHACHGHPKTEFRCHHGQWSAVTSALTCNVDKRLGLEHEEEGEEEEELDRDVRQREWYKRYGYKVLQEGAQQQQQQEPQQQHGLPPQPHQLQQQEPQQQHAPQSQPHQHSHQQQELPPQQQLQPHQEQQGSQPQQSLQHQGQEQQQSSVNASHSVSYRLLDRPAAAAETAAATAGAPDPAGAATAAAGPAAVSSNRYFSPQPIASVPQLPAPSEASPSLKLGYTLLQPYQVHEGQPGFQRGPPEDHTPNAPNVEQQPFLSPWVDQEKKASGVFQEAGGRDTNLQVHSVQSVKEPQVVAGLDPPVFPQSLPLWSSPPTNGYVTEHVSETPQVFSFQNFNDNVIVDTHGHGGDPSVVSHWLQQITNRKRPAATNHQQETRVVTALPPVTGFYATPVYFATSAAPQVYKSSYKLFQEDLPSSSTPTAEVTVNTAGLTGVSSTNAATAGSVEDSGTTGVTELAHRSTTTASTTTASTTTASTTTTAATTTTTATTTTAGTTTTAATTTTSATTTTAATTTAASTTTAATSATTTAASTSTTILNIFSTEGEVETKAEEEAIEVLSSPDTAKEDIPAILSKGHEDNSEIGFHDLVISAEAVDNDPSVLSQQQDVPSLASANEEEKEEIVSEGSSSSSTTTPPSLVEAVNDVLPVLEPEDLAAAAADNEPPAVQPDVVQEPEVQLVTSSAFVDSIHPAEVNQNSIDLTASNDKALDPAKDQSLKIKYKLIRPEETTTTTSAPTTTPSTLLTFKYSLLSSPRPSPESRLKHGEISELPSLVNPFLIKHSANDFSVNNAGQTNHRSPNPIPTTVAPVTEASTTAAPLAEASTTAAVKASYHDGPLYRKALDGVKFNYQGEVEEVFPAAAATNKTKRKSSISFTPTDDQGEDAAAAQNFIGFAKERKISFSQNLVTDHELMEMAKKKHDEEEEKKKQKIVFVSKVDLLNKLDGGNVTIKAAGGKKGGDFIVLNSKLLNKLIQAEEDLTKPTAADLPNAKFPNFPDINNKQDEEEKSCLHPAPVLHGRVRCRGPRDARGRYGHGSTCRVSCDPGFATAGRETATCDPATGAWLSDSPLACEESVAVIVGGWNRDVGMLDSVEVFDPASDCGDVWVAPLPQPRRGLVAAWVDGEVLACGGVNDTSDLNLCWTYDPASNAWSQKSARTAKERHFASTASAGGKLLALGGRDGRERPMALGSAESYSAGEWREEVDLTLTQERAYHCAAAMDDDVVVVTGGYSYNAVVGMAEAFNVTGGGGWESLGNLVRPRYLHGCAAVTLPGSEARQGLLVAGGYDEGYLDSTELYDPAAGRWVETAGRLVAPRQGGKMAVLAGGRPVFLGGFHSMTEFPAAAEEFTGTGWVTLPSGIRTPRRYFAVAEVPRTLFRGRCST